MPILIEKKGRHGIAICPGGHFARVAVPRGVEVGDELPIRPLALWRRPLLTAAAALLLVCGLMLSDLSSLPTSAQGPYALVTLDFPRPAVAKPRVSRQPVEKPPSKAEEDEEARITLALDQGGTVKAVDSRGDEADTLVGLQLEQALDRTVKLLAKYSEDRANLRIRLRPCRQRKDSTTSDTEEIENRIRDTVQDLAAQVAVEVGPPVDQGEIERNHRGILRRRWR